MHGRAKVQLDHFAACHAHITWVFCGQTIARWQGAFIQLHHEICAMVSIWNIGTSHVEATFRISRYQQATHCDYPHIGYARLTFILITVGILVIKHLADDVGAIKGWIWGHAYGGSGDIREQVAIQPGQCPSLVYILTFTHTSTDD